MKLLYVGRNYPNFVAEAKRLGVSRSIPLKDLKNLKWGEEVLCATFHTYGKHEEPDEKHPNGKPINLGEARVLCSFEVRNVLIKEPRVSKAVHERLWQDGLILEFISGGGDVARGCGSYSIGGAAVVSADIEQIYNIILEVKEELQIKVVKLMIGGPLVQRFPAGSGLFDAMFTRSLVDVDLGKHKKAWNFEERLESDNGINKVIRIHKYQTTKAGKYQDLEQAAL